MSLIVLLLTAAAQADMHSSLPLVRFGTGNTSDARARSTTFQGNSIEYSALRLSSPGMPSTTYTPTMPGSSVTSPISSPLISSPITPTVNSGTQTSPPAPLIVPVDPPKETFEQPIPGPSSAPPPVVPSPGAAVLGLLGLATLAARRPRKSVSAVD